MLNLKVKTKRNITVCAQCYFVSVEYITIHLFKISSVFRLRQLVQYTQGDLLIFLKLLLPAWESALKDSLVNELSIGLLGWSSAPSTADTLKDTVMYIF